MTETKQNQLVCWLQKEPKDTVDNVQNTIVLTALLIIWSAFIRLFPFVNYNQGQSSLDKIFASINTTAEVSQLFLYVSGISITEEFLFRLLPLGFLVYYFGKDSLKPLIYATPIAFIFGLNHVYLTGNMYLAILTQGVFALLETLLFLKMGGQSGKWLKPFVYCCLMHLCLNWMMLVSIFWLN